MIAQQNGMLSLCRWACCLCLK